MRSTNTYTAMSIDRAPGDKEGCISVGMRSDFPEVRLAHPGLLAQTPQSPALYYGLEILYEDAHLSRGPRHSGARVKNRQLCVHVCRADKLN